MADTGSGTAAQTGTLHKFEFRGSGSEYFGIWIVNLVLTVLTLGIYGAWAKVRTWRYFYGNTFVGEHALDYHASPVRILIGRLIAVGLLLMYTLSTALGPRVLVFWGPVFLVALPWLINSSLRFNARNTSYRNVRLNFTGRYWAAVVAYVLWPLAAGLSLFTLAPLAHRARDYFFVNNHTFGGRTFHTEFSGWQIYKIYLLVIAMFIGVLVAIGAVVGLSVGFAALRPGAQATPNPVVLLVFPIYVVGLLAIGSYFMAAIFNLSIGHMVLDGRHRFQAEFSTWPLVWLYLSNTFLLVITLGLFYPWALVRLRRYTTSCISLLATSDLDEFTSEVVATQGAIGEEVAAFFDLNIGL